MDRGAEFIEHLPQLRSYARALTGSQNSGDQLVIAVLRRLGQKRHSSNKKSKILLFEVLSILWNGLVGEQLRNINEPSGETKPVDDRPCARQQLSRQALLLVELENFSQDEAAQILHVSAEKFQSILLVAQSEVTAPIATDTPNR